MVRQLDSEGPSGGRGHVAAAWIAIVLLAAATVWLQARRPHGEGLAGNGRGYDLMIMEMQGRYVVGLKQMAAKLGAAQRGLAAPVDLAKQAEPLDSGPPEQRFCFAILIGDLEGPQAALDRLFKFDAALIDRGASLAPDQQRLRNVLVDLYLDLSSEKEGVPDLTPDEQDLLREHLGWFGRLACAQIPHNRSERAAVFAEAQRTMLVLVGGVTAAFLLGMVGLVLFFIQLRRLATGEMAQGLVAPTGHGGIYAETFALWMALYVALSVSLAFAPIPAGRLLLNGGVMVVSVALALAWPVFRGIPWATVRADIGLTPGRAPALEPLLGIATYAMALPLLMIGLSLTLVLMRLEAKLAGSAEEPFGPGGAPSHPVIEYLLGSDWGMRLQVLILAAVVAPLVEETMFRGVLYRHLRDASARLPRLASFLLSGTIVSFLFAVLHPQGWTFVPPLMALAYAFALAREWRGSLIPAMVAHGLNNGLVVLLVILAVGD